MSRCRTRRSRGLASTAVGVVAVLLAGALTASAVSSCSGRDSQRRVVVLNTADSLAVEVDGFVALLGEIEPDVIIDVPDAGPDDLQGVIDAAVDSGPDVIVSFSSAVAVVVDERDLGIAHVFTAVNDPIGSGLVDSFLEPGGGTTGVGGNTQNAKALEYLVQATGARVVGVLIDPGDLGSIAGSLLAREAADEIGVRAVEIEVDPFDVETSLSVPDDVEAIVLPANNRITAVLGEIVPLVDDRPIAAGSTGVDRTLVVLSVEVDRERRVRRLVAIVDAVLDGEDPGTIPVVVPETRLTINAARADALGIEMPDSLMVLATEVID